MHLGFLADMQAEQVLLIEANADFHIGGVNHLKEGNTGVDLVAFLHKVSDGFTREVKEGIAAIERFGKRSPGKEIDCAAMDGQPLLIDRRTGQPIRVRTER